MMFSFVIFFRFLRRLVAFDVMSKTHRWVTFNINLQLFSDCQKKPVNIEEKAVFRAVASPVAGSPRAPFRDFREAIQPRFLRRIRQLEERKFCWL